MREGWEVKTLGEISSIKYGYTAKASFDAIGPKFLRITDIQDGDVNWMAVPSCPISDLDAEKYKLETGDIVFARTGATTGKSYLIDCPPSSVAASYLIRLRLFAGSISPSFVAYFFHTSEYWDAVTAGTSGSAQGGFNASKLGDLSIPLPPLAEQKRIVALLDEAFAGIAVALAAASKNLKNARELFETTLNATFTQKGEGWVETTLIEVTTKIGSGATPRGGASAYKSEGISLIRSLNVYDRRFTERKLAFIDDAQADKLSNVIVEEGDVLFNITGASVARCCIAPPAYLPARVNQHVSILRPIENVLSTDFLCYLMTSRQYKELLLGIGDEGGSTRQAITKKQLQDLKIVIPKTVVEQNDIVSALEDIASQTQRLEALYQQKIDALDELKQSLLQKAFAGALTAEPELLEARA